MAKNIKTRDFGEVVVADEAVITFPEGIYGFEDIREFALIAPLGDNKFPMWLQSVKAENPCFIVFDPLSVKGDYSIDISQHEKEVLLLDDIKDIRCLVLAVIPADYKKATVNLKCPIVINIKKNVGIQLILDNDLSTRERLFEPLSSEKEAHNAGDN